MFRSSKGGKGRVRRPYEHYSLCSSSTPELLDPPSDSQTDSCFKLHQNLSSTCFDVVEENWQDSAYVLDVDKLEERDVRVPGGWICHCCSSHKMLVSEDFGSDPSSDSETESSFRLHQNVSATCFDVVEENWQDSVFNVVEENWQDSAYVLDADNLEEGDVQVPERWIRHCCSCHKMLLVSEAFDSYPSSDSETDFSFRFHQNVSTTCFDIVEENWQDSAYALDVDNWEESDSAYAWDVGNWEESDSAYAWDVGNWEESDFEYALGVHNWEESDSAYAWDVGNWEKSDSAYAWDVGNWEESDSAYALGVHNWEESDSAYALNVDNWEESDVLRGLERWIGHYCSSHKILLVGEGDFSFSANLARAFGCATDMVATSLDSKGELRFAGFLLRNYKTAMSNIQELTTRGCTVLHGVDATEMANHYYLGDLKFDRVIFNFPHAGFRSGESRGSQIRRHRLLVSLFFKNAKEIISENGEIHVRHKSNGFFLDWNLQGLASAVGLRLTQEVPFDLTDYPGYRTKYGFGGDNNFNCNPSKTYKFGLFPAISVSPCGDNNFNCNPSKTIKFGLFPAISVSPGGDNNFDCNPSKTIKFGQFPAISVSP